MIDKLKLVKELGKTAITSILQDHNISAETYKCGIPECDNSSFGLQCSQCKRHLCGNHVYFKLEINKLTAAVTSGKVKAAVKCLCPSCIADNHSEIFESL